MRLCDIPYLDADTEAPSLIATWKKKSLDEIKAALDGEALSEARDEMCWTL